MESMRVVPPSFREQPAGEDVPWLSRQQGENIWYAYGNV